jgi:large subunit ribosomal protein L29
MRMERMVILRSKEIRVMDLEDIQKKLDELKAEYSKNISKSSASGVNENPGNIRELKRTIARVITIMNEKKGEIK